LKDEFRIGRWLVEPQRLALSRDGETVTVKPRSMAVLVELARAHGDVIGRRELMDRVWGDADVTDDVLTQCVVELRRALGDDARRPRYIETIKRVGVRLIPASADLTQAEPAAAPGVPRVAMPLVVMGLITLAVIGLLVSSLPRTVEEPSVAVLPFASYGADETHFADGVAEELLDSLARIPNLRVPARTSSFAFRDRNLDVGEIGRQLRVAHLVEGSVRRSGNHIRVAVQMIDAEDGYHRWSRTYEQELGDVFVVQRQIANDVAGALAVSLGAVAEETRTTNPRAYDLYLAGKHHARLGNIERARGLFEQAVDIDPSYALAHAELAKVLTFFQENSGGIRQSGQDFRRQIERAKAAAASALELAPAEADVHIALASIAAVETDVDAEQAALERAISLNPASVEAYLRLSSALAARRRYREAVDCLETAGELDPLNPELAARHASLIALFEGYDAAVARVQRLIELGLASPMLWDALANLAADFGRYDDRVRYAVQLVNASPDQAWPKTQLGDAFTELGEFELADRWIAAAERISPIEAFKSRVRWHAATRDFEAFARAASAALPVNPESSVPLTLEQSVSSGLSGIAALNTGHPAQAVMLIRQSFAHSPTMWRRKPYIPIFTMIVLARALRANDEAQEMREVLEDARRLVTEAGQAGIVAYPWITVASASVYQLSGEADRASQTFREAVAQGWRAWKLEELGVAQPLAGEAESIRLIEADLERMRKIVRREGLAIAPPAEPYTE
jgi:TolB-like protein/DNA-binding winged helix-turn-helix (wHTH) protein